MNARGKKMTDHVSGQTKGAAPLRVWDPLVRVFHWGLVAAFATAWLTADEVQPIHEVAGYTVAGLVALRLICEKSQSACSPPGIRPASKVAESSQPTIREGIKLTAKAFSPKRKTEFQ